MIRGMNSINSGTSPLYILDGVAIASSDFNTINPADIESIGARAQGRLLHLYIWCARGQRRDRHHDQARADMAERAKIKLTVCSSGFSQIAYGNWDLMDTGERIQYEKEIGFTDGKNYNVLGKRHGRQLARRGVQRCRPAPELRTFGFGGHRQDQLLRLGRLLQPGGHRRRVRPSSVSRSAPTSSSRPPNGSSSAPTR